MRTLEEIAYDNLRLSDCEKATREILLEYINLSIDIHNRKSVTPDKIYNDELIEGMKKMKEQLTSDRIHEGMLNFLFDMHSYTIPTEAKNGRCPKCNEIFPADLWQWYDSLFCPYCGQRVVNPQYQNEEDVTESIAQIN